MNEQDPRQVLARRLRALREEHWPGAKVNQAQLAAALGGDRNRPVSVPLVSSWESRTNPKVPPASRIKDIATFYATPRSFDGEVSRLLDPDEMTVEERTARQQLLQELTRLRSDAHNASKVSRSRVSIPDAHQVIAQSLNTGPWHFEDRNPITIVCAQLPQEMLQRIPYADPLDPDYIDLYRFSDLDALIELHGHLRAANATSQVHIQVAHELQRDEYTSHLVVLGGVDWNRATVSVMDRLQLPVKQVSNWDKPDGAYYEVMQEDGRPVSHRTWLETSGERPILREDVALFAWAVSPFNRKRFVTICNGMYASGTLGAVLALTDELFRDRNAEYLRETFGRSDAFCILSRVTVENGRPLTPDWTLPETRLFEWSRPE